MFNEINISRSIKIFIQTGFPEQWVKAGGTVTIKEGQDELEVWNKAYDILGDVLQKEIKKISPEQPLDPPKKTIDSAERIAFRKKLSKCKTIADLSRFNREQKGMTDIYTERLKEIQKK